MAGRQHNSPGSGNGSLCLPSDPTWGNYHDGGESWEGSRAYIFGTEIDTNDDAEVISYKLNEQDMCKTNTVVNVVIPASTVCY